MNQLVICSMNKSSTNISATTAYSSSRTICLAGFRISSHTIYPLCMLWSLMYKDNEEKRNCDLPEQKIKLIGLSKCRFLLWSNDAIL